MKVRNNTLRTFRIQPGDVFYTAIIDGTPYSDGFFEVCPGFDQDCEGLVVPWAHLTNYGLEISEVDSNQMIRLVVGPVLTDGENQDWLQYRSGEWECVEEKKWLMLGERHLFGAVGSCVDIVLTFRDARSQSTDGRPADLNEVLHVDYAIKCESTNTVWLNVFDLASAVSIPNALFCNTVVSTLGAFHAAIEVYGEEWAFYRTPNPTSCGVCKSLRPRQHPVHVYRQSIKLGSTTLKDWEVRYLIRGKLATKWPGGTYDLLRRNCIHFCEELALGLGVQPVPAWVRGLHELGASVLQLPWPLSAFFGSGRGNPALENRGEENSDDDDHPGETASFAASDVTRTSITSFAYPASNAPSVSTANDGGRASISAAHFIGEAKQDIRLSR